MEPGGSMPHSLGASIKHVKGGGGGRRSVTFRGKGGRDPKFCDITFQK